MTDYNCIHCTYPMSKHVSTDQICPTSIYQPPPPVDCELSEWALTAADEWGPCQPASTQTRTEWWTRLVLTAPAYGGAECGPLTEKRTGTQSCVYVPPTPHDYFNALAARADAVYAYSLRDQDQLNRYAQGTFPSDSISYDPDGDTYQFSQDAARVLIRTDRPSVSKQVRLPIMTLNGESLLLTWDAWFGSEYADAVYRGGLNAHKTFQIAGRNGTAGLWFEVRTQYAQAKDGFSIGKVDARGYGLVGPNTVKGGNDRLEPILGTFLIAPRTWTRYWAQVELIEGDWDRVSLWVADETREAVQLYDRVELESGGGLTQLYLEYNSSQTRTGGPLVGYVRNVVGLREAGDVPPLLQRPLGEENVIQ